MRPEETDAQQQHSARSGHVVRGRRGVARDIIKRAGVPADLRLQPEMAAEVQRDKDVQEAGELPGGTRDNERHSDAGLRGVRLAVGSGPADTQDPQRNSDRSHDGLAV